MGLFGPPDIEKLKRRGRVKKLVKLLGYTGASSFSTFNRRKKAAQALDDLGWKASTQQEKVAYSVAIGDWERCAEIGEPAVPELVCLLRILSDDWRAIHRPYSASVVDSMRQHPEGAALLDVFARIGAPAVEPLVEALETGSNPLAATVLACIGDPRAVAGLRRALEDGPPFATESHQAPAEALGYFPDPDNAEILLEVLRAVGTSDMSLTTTVALGRVGPQLDDRDLRRRIIEALSTAAHHDLSSLGGKLRYLWRDAATEALEGFDEPEARRAYLRAREAIGAEKRAEEEQRQKMREERAAHEAAKARIKRGGLGEPYCSQACFEQGAKFALLELGRPNCGVCGNPVPVSATGQRSYAVVPFQGKALVVCQTCIPKIKQRLRGSHECCFCGKRLYL